jgi:hypothetical protein
MLGGKMHLKAIVISVAMIAQTCIVAIAGEPKYPSEFPSTFPQFKGCKMVQTMNFPGNTSAMLDCGKSSEEKIYSFYLNNAKQDGWKVLMENKTQGHSMLMVEKGDVAMQIQVFKQGDTVQLALSYVQHSN